MLNIDPRTLFYVFSKICVIVYTVLAEFKYSTDSSVFYFCTIIILPPPTQVALW